VDITLATLAASKIFEIFIEKPSLLLVLLMFHERYPGERFRLKGLNSEATLIRMPTFVASDGKKATGLATFGQYFRGPHRRALCRNRLKTAARNGTGVIPRPTLGGQRGHRARPDLARIAGPGRKQRVNQG